MLKTIFILIILFVVSSNSQELCRDYRLYDGGETLFNYGMDTTFNWWAITTPTPNRQRLIVNGEESQIYSSVNPPVFSYDGLAWATFGIDQGVTTLLTRDTTIFLFASEPGEILFSSISDELVYTYKKGDLEYAVLPNRTIEMLNKSGNLFVNQNATKYAYSTKRGSSFSLIINGKETTIYDRIIPIGFNIENQFVYAAFSGNGWQVYADNKTISEIYPDFYEYAINREGTVIAFNVRSFNSRQLCITISHEYYEPLISKQYESVSNLALHPYLALVGFSATFQTNRYVAINSAEYFAGIRPGPPKFTYDGDELYFMSCDMDCFMNINGKRYTLKIVLEPGNQIAVAPGTKTFAYSTSSSMMLYFLETGAIHSGMMVDYITAPRYNRFDKRYEAIGSISNRLYMLTCTPPERFNFDY
jgi:hypothetical protein